MKKVIFIIFFLYTLVYSDNGQSLNSINLTNEEKNYIIEHPIVTYSEVNWEPLSIIIDNKKMQGIMGDFLELLEKKTNLKFKYISSNSWPEVLEKFKNGEIDVIPGAGDSNYEKSLGSLSDTYAEYPMVIVTKGQYSFLNNLNDLKRKVISVPKYYTSYNYIKENYKDFVILPKENIEESLLSVQNGESEAFVGHIATSLFYMNKLHLDDLKISGTTTFKFRHHYLIKSDNKILISIINKAFKSISEKQKQEIYEKWIKIKISEPNYEYQLFILGVFLLVIVGLIVRNRAIKRFLRAIENQQEKTLKEKSKFEAIFFNSKDGMAVIDSKSYKIRRNNTEFEYLTELNNKELKKSDLRTLFFPDSNITFKEFISKIERIGYIHDYIIEHNCGNEYMKFFNITMSFDSKNECFLISIRDVSDVFLLKQNLEKEVEKANSATKAKSIFLANMSHEIRTPLNGVLSMAQYISKYSKNDDIVESATIIERSTNNLISIVNDILDITKIEAGKIVINKTKVDIHSMIETIFNNNLEKLNDKNIDWFIDISTNTPQFIFTDELRISQIIQNLISNALKFTDFGEIILKVEISGENRIKFIVKDTGIGISESEVKKIFNDFEQLDQGNTKNYQGIGLGLSLSKKLARILDGDLYLDYNSKKYTTFVCEISAKFSDEVSEVYGKYSGKKVAILDFNKNWVNAVKNSISALGFDVETFSDADYLLKELISSSNSFDYVFLNSTYNTIPCIDFMSQLNEYNESFSAIPLPNIIISINGLSNKYIMDFASGFGVKYFVKKPLTPYNIDQAIQHLINKEEMVIDEVKKRDSVTTFEKSKILLAEDNELNQNIVQMLLKDTNIELDIVSNGLDAVESFTRKAKEYKLILMDVQMPYMDGLEATKQIRDIDSDIPIIGLSANAYVSDIQRATNSGMNDYICKPIDMNEFYHVLSKYIKKEEYIVTEEESIDMAKEDLNLYFNHIDLNLGLKNCYNDENFYIEMLSKFYKKYRDKLKDCHLECNSGDDKRIFIHTIKGLSLTIGAEKLHKISLALYQELDNPVLIENFKKEFINLLSELEVYYEIGTKIKDNSYETKDNSSYNQLLKDLKVAILSKRIKKCRDVLDKIKTKEIGLKERDFINNISELVENREFKKALTLMEG